MDPLIRLPCALPRRLLGGMPDDDIHSAQVDNNGTRDARADWPSRPPRALPRRLLDDILDDDNSFRPA